VNDALYDPPAYCHAIESYLCRKNDGHLIRIVGPAFEQVCGWAASGVPLKVAFRGIDRYFERYYAKGPRRRPVRIEFCEADVLDVFDEWRRAVGVGPRPPAEDGDPSPPPRDSLPAHVDRVIVRLTTARGGANSSVDRVIDDIVRELDAARSRAAHLRGEPRQAFIDRLRALDDALIEAARNVTAADTLRELAGEADTDLAPFRARMPADAYTHARRAAVDRLLRERHRLPVISYD
jgi:hypothetical protein